MSVRTELREWQTALKDLWREERRKHPVFGWVVLVVAFFYVVIEGSRYWGK